MCVALRFAFTCSALIFFRPMTAIHPESWSLPEAYQSFPKLLIMHPSPKRLCSVFENMLWFNDGGIQKPKDTSEDPPRRPPGYHPGFPTFRAKGTRKAAKEGAPTRTGTVGLPTELAVAGGGPAGCASAGTDGGGGGIGRS